MPEFGERTAAKRAGEAASAAAALPLLLELIPATTSLVHVGFGSGEWLAEAQRLGVSAVHGIDGPWASLDGLLVAPGQVTIVDTRQSFRGGKYDLAVCTEYAEHLPDSRAASFVADLAALAPVIAFSAAIPGQGGKGHVNEQWPSYWEAHFAAVGFHMVDAIRHQLWNAPGMPSYLAQNLLIAIDQGELTNYPRLAQLAADRDGGVRSLVHPVIYEQKMQKIETLRAPFQRRTWRLTRPQLRAAARRVRHWR
jgi:hypothetical protein